MEADAKWVILHPNKNTAESLRHTLDALNECLPRLWRLDSNDEFEVDSDNVYVFLRVLINRGGELRQAAITFIERLALDCVLYAKTNLEPRFENYFEVEKLIKICFNALSQSETLDIDLLRVITFCLLLNRSADARASLHWYLFVRQLVAEIWQLDHAYSEVELKESDADDLIRWTSADMRQCERLASALLGGHDDGLEREVLKVFSVCSSLERGVEQDEVEEDCEMLLEVAGSNSAAANTLLCRAEALEDADLVRKYTEVVQRVYQEAGRGGKSAGSNKKDRFLLGESFRGTNEGPTRNAFYWNSCQIGIESSSIRAATAFGFLLQIWRRNDQWTKERKQYIVNISDIFAGEELYWTNVEHLEVADNYQADTRKDKSKQRSVMMRELRDAKAEGREAVDRKWKPGATGRRRHRRMFSYEWAMDIQYSNVTRKHRRDVFAREFK